MQSVKASQDAMIKTIEGKDNLKQIKTFKQDDSKLIRYSRNSDFNEIVAEDFLNRKDSPEFIKSCLNKVKDKNHPLYTIYDNKQ